MTARWASVRLVATAEFRMRIRAGRWPWLLASWFGILVLFQVLLALGLHASHQRDTGPALFGGLMLFVLGLALLVVPALSASSINGDRERGTLAPLQASLLRSYEIALGKLLSACGTALVFLALTLPLVAWAYAAGGLALGRVVVTLLVVALLLGVAASLAECLSSLLRRTTTSTALAYLLVFALTLGTVIGFGLVSALTAAEDGTSSHGTWVLLAPNPFVVLADASPTKPVRVDLNGNESSTPLDPLSSLAGTVREIRHPQRFDPAPDVVSGVVYIDRGPAVWPWGLGFDVALALAALAVTTRRLRTPAARLPQGARVA